jgi:hypothetical protein
VPLGLEGYELCHPVRQDDFERINVEINGTPRACDWKLIPVRLVREDQRLELSVRTRRGLGRMP